MNGKMIAAVGLCGCAFGLNGALACPPGEQSESARQETISLGMLAKEEPKAAAPQEKKVVELAICLDTSGSMEGLINAARQKLWEIVNDLALAKPTPALRVALLTYGNDGHNAEN